MKKTLSLILALLMILSLAACGGNSAPTETPTEAPTEAPTEVSAEAPTEVPTEAPSGESVSGQSLVGTYENGIYTNEAAGLRCELGENWAMATGEELAALQNSVSDVLDDSAAKELLETSGSLTACYGYSRDGLQNFNIVIQNVGLLYGTLLDAELYTDTMLPQMEQMLPAMGYTDLTVEKSTVTFRGSEQTALCIHASVNGVTLHQVQVAYTVGSDLIILTVSCYAEDTTQEILDMFSALET